GRMGTHDLLVDSEQRHKNRVRQAGRTSGGLALGSDATVGMLQALQRTAGNAAVNTLLRRYAIQRCGDTPCDCSPEEKAASVSPAQEDPAVQTIARRYDTLPSVPVQRTAVQRDDDDPPDPPDPWADPAKRPDPITGPGGPGDTNDRGFTCGIENGKFTCHVDVGKGDPLQLPGDWSSSPRNDPKIKGPSDCPPGQYNKLMMKCCAVGAHADASGMKCVTDQQQEQDPFTVPPAPPEQKGDFPDDPDAATQNA
ncbi:MAG: hypothetical protein LC769_07945, partial [Chloroflexi bacterium]|nr:hypothetical protein [Chloroflexota bacterium]